jgi:hypothetical protein
MVVFIMDNNFAVKITTAIIVIIILAILVYKTIDEDEVDDPQPLKLEIPGTRLVSVVYNILNISKISNNWLKINTKQVPGINSQMFINDSFVGNVVAYSHPKDNDGVALLMDRDVDINGVRSVCLITTQRNEDKNI